MLNKRQVIFGIGTMVVLVTAIFVMAYFKNSQKTTDTKSAKLIKVELRNNLAETGVVKNNNIRQIHMPVNTDLSVKNGDSIKKNQILGTHRSAEITNQVSEAKAELKKLEQTLEINKMDYNLELNKKKESDEKSEKITETQKKYLYENAIEAVNVQKEKIDSLGAKSIEYYYAPFDGTVETESNSDGSYTLNIYSNKKHIESSVTEFDYGRLTIGQEVIVKILVSGSKTKQKLYFLSNHASTSTTNNGSSEYKFILSASPSMVDGQTVKISIPSKELIIPSMSVKKINSKLYVHKRIHGSFKKILVTGKFSGNMFIVKSGLSLSDKIKKDY